MTPRAIDARGFSATKSITPMRLLSPTIDIGAYATGLHFAARAGHEIVYCEFRSSGAYSSSFTRGVPHAARSRSATQNSTTLFDHPVSRRHERGAHRCDQPPGGTGTSGSADCPRGH